MTGPRNQGVQIWQSGKGRLQDDDEERTLHNCVLQVEVKVQIEAGEKQPIETL